MASLAQQDDSTWYYQVNRDISYPQSYHQGTGNSLGLPGTRALLKASRKSCLSWTGVAPLPRDCCGRAQKICETLALRSSPDQIGKQAAYTHLGVEGSWSIPVMFFTFFPSIFSIRCWTLMLGRSWQTTGGPVTSKCHVQMSSLKIHFQMKMLHIFYEKKYLIAA